MHTFTRFLVAISPGALDSALPVFGRVLSRIATAGVEALGLLDPSKTVKNIMFLKGWRLKLTTVAQILTIFSIDPSRGSKTLKNIRFFNDFGPPRGEVVQPSEPQNIKKH